MSESPAIKKVLAMCQAKGLDSEVELRKIDELMAQGKSEVAAVLQWRSQMAGVLSSTTMDIEAVLMAYDIQGRTITTKAGKQMIVHDAILLANVDPELGYAPYQVPAWEGGDRENRALLDALGEAAPLDCLKLSGMIVKDDLSAMSFSDSTQTANASLDVKDALTKAIKVSVNRAPDFEGIPKLYTGTLVRVAISEKSVGMELGDIGDDLDQIPEPRMVWFDRTPDVDIAELEQTVGSDIVALAVFRARKKDNGLAGNGYTYILL